MARIAGVDLPRDKALLYALPLIYGLGPKTAADLIDRAGLDPRKKVRELNESEIGKLREILDSEFQVEGDLRREVYANIRRLIEIGSFRGLRHRRGLPTRGQRTRSNAELERVRPRRLPERRRRRSKV